MNRNNGCLQAHEHRLLAGRRHIPASTPSQETFFPCSALAIAGCRLLQPCQPSNGDHHIIASRNDSSVQRSFDRSLDFLVHCCKDYSEYWECLQGVTRDCRLAAYHR